MKVLLIEDDERVISFLDRGLRAEGFRVTLATTGAEGTKLGQAGDFDVIVLDLMLPDLHGYDVCQRLRVDKVATPILMLTAMDTLEDKVRGLRLGADDYLTKPFAFDELLARLEALMRRSRGLAPSETLVTVGTLSFDRDALEVRCGGQPVELTPKELAILELLMSAPGKVFSRERILSNVWGYDSDPLTNVVDVYIGRLRKKLSADGAAPSIATVRGYGYKLDTGA
ncbi:MAG: response regulator transcription factor [Alphaproteobacteria bacterium]|nr:response regulator transcription factor [Alphaproteobacteria bacterium]